MPESRECEADYVTLHDSTSAIIEKTGPLALEAIEIDATDKEASQFPKNHPTREGLPYTIDSSSTVKRGTNRSQSYVYPEIFGPLTDLALQDISYTHRALILNLGPLFLMIQWLTHSWVQLFPRSEYESTIQIVNKKVHHVIAFLSSDLVFQPTWAFSRDTLPPSPSDFYSRGWDFLPALTEWMLSRLHLDRNGLACEVIRAANDVFLGIGISPLLTEAEVFSNPSRVARLCGAYIEYQHKSRTGLRQLLRPAMRDGYLAPTQRQRLGYIDWLHVYAKDRSKIPVRMAELVDDYVVQVEERLVLPQKWVRYDADFLYDVFEPTFLSTALSSDHNLGHLVFGTQTWIDLGGKLSDRQDAVTAYFAEQGLLDTQSFLKPDHYSPLFLPNHDFRAQSLPHRKVHTYRNDKQIWSITPMPDD
ncbi:hypothetical protein B0H12DRAFT_1148920 [Mycena haematopus]|nr:hypothetical protein B0H12DRAFT_1148920 [Mycena haematopus]